MGFFDLTLRCALVVASVVAEGGGSHGKIHQEKNIQIGFGNGGLIGSFSEPSHFRPPHSSPGKLFGSGDSLHSFRGDVSQGRFVNNDIGGRLSSQHGVSAKFGGRNFDEISDSRTSEIRGSFGSSLSPNDNIQGVSFSRSNSGRSSSTGIRGVGHPRGPFLIQGQGFRLEDSPLKDSGSFAGHQGSELVNTRGGFGTSHGGQDTHFSGVSRDVPIPSSRVNGIGASHNIENGHIFGSEHGIDKAQAIGSGHGPLRGNFGVPASDFGKDQLSVHGTNLGDDIFEMLKGQKLVGFDAGVAHGHFQPIKGHGARGQTQSLNSGIQRESLTNFGKGIAGGFDGHENFQKSIGGGLSNIGVRNTKSVSDDAVHEVSPNFRNEIKDGGFDESKGQFAASHGHFDGGIVDVTSGRDFEGQGSFIKGDEHGPRVHSAGGRGGHFSNQPRFLDENSSVRGIGGEFSVDKLRSSSHGGIFNEGAVEDSGDKFRVTGHLASHRGNINNFGGGSGSLHDFGGSDHVENERGIDSNVGRNKDHEGSFRNFDSSIIHGQKEVGNFGRFGSSIVQGGKEGSSFGGTDSGIVVGGKGGGSFSGLGGNIGHDSGFNIAGFGGIEGGNFFGYTEKDFLGISGGTGDSGIAGLENIGARVVSYDGHEVSVGDSNLDSFVGTLGGRGIGHAEDVIRSGFRSGFPLGGVGSNSFNIGHGVGSQDFDTGTAFGSGFGDGKSEGFSDSVRGKLEDSEALHGGKFGGHSDRVVEDLRTGGVSGDVVGSFDSGNFGEDSDDHGRTTRDHGAFFGVDEETSVRTDGRTRLVTHHPGNPYGINGSA